MHVVVVLGLAVSLSAPACRSSRKPVRRRDNAPITANEQPPLIPDGGGFDYRCLEHRRPLRTLLGHGFDQVVLETCEGHGFPDRIDEYRVRARLDEFSPWIEVVESSSEDSLPFCAAAQLVDGRLAVVMGENYHHDLCVTDADTRSWVCSDLLALLRPPDERVRFGTALSWAADLEAAPAALRALAKHVQREYSRRSPGQAEKPSVREGNEY